MKMPQKYDVTNLNSNILNSLKTNYTKITGDAIWDKK
jgi:hypothetical protein